MKIKITRSDGTVIEAEGTPEECARLMPYPAIQYVPVPTYIPTIRMKPPYPGYPWGTWCTDGLGASSVTHIGTSTRHADGTWTHTNGANS